jgi:hypothetical protein
MDDIKSVVNTSVQNSNAAPVSLNTKQFDPDIAALNISNRQKKRMQWKRDYDKYALSVARQATQLRKAQTKPQPTISVRKELPSTHNVVSPKQYFVRLRKVAKRVRNLLIKKKMVKALSWRKKKKREFSMLQASIFKSMARKPFASFMFVRWLYFRLFRYYKKRMRRRVKQGMRREVFRRMRKFGVACSVLFPQRRKYVLPTRLLNELGFWSYAFETLSSFFV